MPREVERELCTIVQGHNQQGGPGRRCSGAQLLREPPLESHVPGLDRGTGSARE
jgi:hypothetical protein